MLDKYALFLKEMNGFPILLEILVVSLPVFANHCVAIEERALNLSQDTVDVVENGHCLFSMGLCAVH